MTKRWTTEDVLELTGGYEAACILVAAAELDIVAVLADGPLSAEQVAERIDADRRGAAILLDALSALGLLEKSDRFYRPAPGVTELLTEHGSQSILAMVRHRGVCIRRWAQLANVVKTGVPTEPTPSILGQEGDRESFIEAMDNISRPVADQVVADVGFRDFRHLLDIGGASGTWTIAHLKLNPTAKATLFDLPAVIPMARRRLEQAGILDRVTLAAGDFYVDPLPAGADLAWLGAIVHQNSREQNRQLFAKVFAALLDGGKIAIRDVVMEPSRIHPPRGALFAVNMLSATEGGGTFTLEELQEDLESAGFSQVRLARSDPWMNCVVVACREK